jgi:hypothetical protein
MLNKTFFARLADCFTSKISWHLMFHFSRMVLLKVPEMEEIDFVHVSIHQRMLSYDCVKLSKSYTHLIVSQHPTKNAIQPLMSP